MKTTFTATGDSFTTRRIPDYPGRKELQEFIKAHDVNFNNLEMTYHDHEGYPSAFSGGTWAMADPGILDDIKEMGFNLFNTANNHAMDYGHGGLMATIRNLKQRQMVFSGTGANSYEASKACYLETAQSRVALISLGVEMHDSDIPGPQGAVMGGRPGINPLRCNTTYHVTQEQFRALEAIATETKMNAWYLYGVSLGYVKPLPEGKLSFNGMTFVTDTDSFIETRPHPADLERTVNEINDAKLQADYVMVSIHVHAFDMKDMSRVPEYVETFAHACIDAGADAILGHGPHELRGIEIYQGKPIFYSLGNFIFETETVSEQPAEAFTNMGLPADTKIAAFMDNRSAHGTRGYAVQPPIWFSVIPEWTLEDGKVSEILLHPISLGMQLPRSRKGVPALAPEMSGEVFAHLQKLCDAYGTKIEVKDGIGRIRIG